MVDIKKVKESYIFNKEYENKNTYLCSCGNFIEKEREKNEDGTNVSEVKIKNSSYEALNMEDILDKGSLLRKVVCEKCQKNYDDEFIIPSIVPVNSYFLESFSFEENEESLILNKEYVIGKFIENNPTDNQISDDGSFLIRSEKSFKIESLNSYLCFNKNTKLITIKYKDGEEISIELSVVLKSVSKFFENNKDVKISDNLIEIHRFVNRLANFVVDSKNFNIVGDILNEMLGKPGIETLKKAISIFFGIICYPNLSTIALTKNLVFLYDMMNNCSLPNTKILSDNGITSPLKIFNFLVSIEKEKIQKSLEDNRRENNDFVYQSKNGKTFSMNFSEWIDRIERVQSTSITKQKEGLKVIEDIKQKEVSKFIFKKIKKFSDYKTLMRYTNIISYEDLISLSIKHDVDFLLNLLPIVEFRDGIDLERLNQIISIAKTYLIKNQILFNFVGHDNDGRDNVFNMSNEEIEKYISHYKLDSDISNTALFNHMKKHIEINPNMYESLRWFNFEIYDDSLHMINTLNFDPNREFYKIKDIDELEKYHNDILVHFNMLSDKQKTLQFKNFVSKFKILEDYNEDGMRVKLIPDPTLLIKEANEMSNCAGSYVTRVTNGQYLLLTIDDNNKDRKSKEAKRFMLGLRVSKDGLEFDQVKSAFNERGSDRFKRQVIEYLKTKDISFRDYGDIKLNNRVEESFLRN